MVGIVPTIPLPSIPHPPELKVDSARWCFEMIGRREWDRTTDHFHVKEVLYH